MSPQDLLLLNALVGIVLPLLVALVTKQAASSGLKSAFLLGLSALGGYLTTLLYNDAAVDWKSVAVASLTVFVSAVASYYGFTKQVKLAGAEGVIQTKIPGGLGKAA